MSEAFHLDKDYRREHGLHTFTLQDGTNITAIAEPSWEDFQQTLETLPRSQGYIISPELITTSVPLSDIRSRKAEIQTKIEIVRKLSTNHPDAFILLGSASFDKNKAMRNSLVVIADGEIRGHVDKRGAMWPLEGREFSRKLRPQSTLRSMGHATLICSDIITAVSYGRSAEKWKKDTFIPPNAESLLISSCWAVPQIDSLPTPTTGDERFLGPLERSMIGLFDGYPQLKEIVMVDKSIAVSETAPYTAHFTRAESYETNVDSTLYDKAI